MNNRVFGKFGVAGGLSLSILLHTSTAWADTIQVRAGDNLQAWINAAQPGDTLLLPPGVTFSGNFVLPVKAGNDFITIRTAPGGGLPADGIRIAPTHAPYLARIQSPNNAPAIATAVITLVLTPLAVSVAPRLGERLPSWRAVADTPWWTWSGGVSDTATPSSKATTF